jgi:hypothetical protein
MLALAAASQRFQLVPRRRGQDAKLSGRVDLEQLAESNAFKGAEAFAVVIAEELLGVL